MQRQCLIHVFKEQTGVSGEGLVVGGFSVFLLDAYKSTADIRDQTMNLSSRSQTP